jgi:hypothetical protein
MPKASKEATLKVKLQARALYELGKYNHEQICESVKKSGGNLTRKTLAKWIKEDHADVWQIRDLAENRIYDAQKIAHKAKIMKSFKKQEEQIKDDILTRQAIEDATNEAVILINLERERNKQLIETLETNKLINKYIINLLAKGKTGTLTEEDVMMHGKAVDGMKKQIKTIEEHKIGEVVQAGNLITKQLQGLGFYQTQPTALIQNNNIGSQLQPQNIPLEVATQEEAVEVRKELLKQLK